MSASTFSTPDGTELQLYRWQSPAPRAQVLLIHGMAEHAKRYERLAQFLNSRGISVWAHDQRGHGHSLSPTDTPMFVAEKDGLRLLIEDVRHLAHAMHSEYPNTPLYLLGHSFGSLVACNVVQRDPDLADGLVLSALPEYNAVLTALGQGLAVGQAGLLGARSQAKLHLLLSFGLYNRKFKPNRTDFDWISSDEREVDQYIADPMCGTPATVHFFRDLMDALQHAHSAEHWRASSRQVPVFAFAGSEDAVAGMQKGFLKSMARFEQRFDRLDFWVQKGARHEVLFDAGHELLWERLADGLLDWTGTLALD